MPCKFCGRACEWPKLETVPEHPKDARLLTEMGVKFAICTAKHEAELLELCRSDGQTLPRKFS